jgi:N-acetylglucosamine kinase-like BadF-type ATPase
MSYCIGFDGGGTKTECVLLDSAGNVEAQVVAGPSNPLRIGFDAAFQALTEGAEQVLSAGRVDAKQVSAVCAGLAGAGAGRVVKRAMGHLTQLFPRADVHVTTDMEAALEAAVGQGQGVVLIAGTGSAAFGRSAAGKIARAGGHGPWIGDEGSAYDIGRRAVITVARARDLLGPVTLLAEMIPSALECPTWDALMDRISRNPHEVFPRIFPLVVDAAEADDDPAREILFGAALGLGALAAAVIRRLGLNRKEFTLAKSGGVFGRTQYLDQPLDALLASAAAKMKVEMLRVSPAVGAARIALRLARASAPQVAHAGKR